MQHSQDFGLSEQARSLEVQQIPCESMGIEVGIGRHRHMPWRTHMETEGVARVPSSTGWEVCGDDAAV